VDEGFVTVGSITRSRIYGCSSESGGEVRVTGWWPQVVDATGWVAQFL